MNLNKQLLLATSSELGSTEENAEYISKIQILATQDTPDVSSLGRLVIKAEEILNGDLEDIALMGGDMIRVPRKPQTVKVIGEVYAPNSHFYYTNNTPYDYLDLSGGLNEYADEDNIYIIKTSGSVFKLSSSGGFFRNARNNIEPGDTIVVPIQINTFSGLKATTELTQIIYQMALSAAAVKSF